MTAPLVVLGVLSVVGGAFNLPELVDGKASLQHWLAPVSALAGRVRPVVELSKAVERMLAGGAVVVAGLGIVGAALALPPGAPEACRGSSPGGGPRAAVGAERAGWGSL